MPRSTSVAGPVFFKFVAKVSWPVPRSPRSGATCRCQDPPRPRHGSALVPPRRSVWLLGGCWIQRPSTTSATALAALVTRLWWILAYCGLHRFPPRTRAHRSRDLARAGCAAVNHSAALLPRTRARRSRDVGGSGHAAVPPCLDLFLRPVHVVLCRGERGTVPTTTSFAADLRAPVPLLRWIAAHNTAALHRLLPRPGSAGPAT